MKVNVYMTDGFETVEALAVVDILRRAGIQTEMVSVTGKYEVLSAQNVTVTADRLFNMEEEKADVLFLPGGPGTASFDKVDGLRGIFVEHNMNGGVIAAICAAPAMLGKWGILKGKNATCYPGFEKELNGAMYVASARVVVAGNIITGRGPGTAIDLALALVEKLQSEDNAVKMGMDFQYIDNE